MKTDIEMLKECLEESEKLSETTEEAFRGMLYRLESGQYRGLMAKQRQWVMDEHARLGFDDGAANLVSTGMVKVTAMERADMKNFLSSLGSKPLAPPGRVKKAP